MTRKPLRSLCWLSPLIGTALAILFIPLPTPAPQVRHITIDATQFQFNPGRVEVNEGDRLIITLTASDVTHGFYLDGYGIEQRLIPGISRQIELTANQTGTFRFRCAVSCGPLHPFMIGELVVNPNFPFLRASGVLLVLLIGMFIHLWQSKGPSYVAAQANS